MQYFDTPGGTTLITTLLLNHQEAIQFRAAEIVKYKYTLNSVYTRNHKTMRILTIYYRAALL